MGKTEKAHTGKVCNVCGAEGFHEELLTCSQCKIREHFYCTVNFPTSIAESWICEVCDEENKQTMHLPSRSMPLNKTKKSAKVKFISAEEVASLASGSKTPTATLQPISINSLSKSFMTIKSEDVSATPLSISINSELAGLDSRSDLQVSSLHMKDEQLMASDKALGLCTDIQLVESDIQGIGLSSTLRMVPNENEIQWRGRFMVKDMGDHMYEDIRAYFPDKISMKAYNASKAMPEMLQCRLFERMDIWPQIFQLDPPSCDDVAMYFLPSEIDRIKEKYICLLERMSKCDLAMHCCFDGLELLIYTSKLLSLDPQGFNTSLYLWGIFRRLRGRN